MVLVKIRSGRVKLISAGFPLFFITTQRIKCFYILIKYFINLEVMKIKPASSFGNLYAGKTRKKRAFRDSVAVYHWKRI